MLKLTLLSPQIKEMSRHLLSEKPLLSNQIEQLISALDKYSKDHAQLAKKVKESNLTWGMALPTEELNAKYDCPPVPQILTVIAVDGSQIQPDYHEITDCCLINVGAVVLHYGTKEKAVLESYPHLLYKEDELYLKTKGRSFPLTEGEEFNALRNRYEHSAVRKIISKKYPNPTAIFLDGTLIQWYLEKFKASELKDYFINEFSAMLTEAGKKDFSLLGYISRSRNYQVINLLRLADCPYEERSCNNCQPNCFEKAEKIEDADLFARILQKGQRSALFKCHTKVLDYYKPGEQIYFFYLNTGWEIARIELPAWVIENPEKLAFCHAVTFDQVTKGQGYPISLAEAHESAVVSHHERSMFYQLVNRLFLKDNLTPAISYKSLLKRRKIV